MMSAATLRAGALSGAIAPRRGSGGSARARARRAEVAATKNADDASCRATHLTPSRASSAPRLAHRAHRRARRRARLLAPTAALPIDDLGAAANAIADVAAGIGLPCTIQNCGDQIYRSTLDAELRGEVAPLFTPTGLTILGSLGFYLTITPGVLGGFVDYYVLRPLLGQRSFSLDDFVIGNKLGEGGFGVVYKATGVEDGETYVLKRCKDYGEAEIWTNSRLMRACPKYIAKYQGAFYGPKEKGAARGGGEQSIWKRAKSFAQKAVEVDDSDDDDPLWLVWKFEGSETLNGLMQSKEFPYNVEPFLFRDSGGVAVEGEPRGPARKKAIIQRIFKQILECLSGAHATGIILRDVKPENMIFDPKEGRFKLIDLGAAADLRFGFNYQPKEFILDPRFSGPEEYIMSTQTPEAPATPVALALSPALWQLNVPDRFDSYSAGVVLLQMCLPSLRSDDNLIAFRRKLEENGESLQAWRKELPSRMFTGENGEGFDVLDADDRAGWELVKSLMFKEREKRSSATGAKFSRFIVGKNPFVTVLDGIFGASPDEDDAEAGGIWAWLVFRVARSGTNREGGFTEAQLNQFKDEGSIDKTEDASKYLGYVATETLAKYGVKTVPRTVGGGEGDKKAKAKVAGGGRGGGGGEGGDDDAPALEKFNPFRALNAGLQRLQGKE